MKFLKKPSEEGKIKVEQDKIKIAIVDHRVSAGGVSRFIVALTGALVKKYPDLEIGLFVCDETVKRDSLDKLFTENSNIKIFPFSGSDNYTQTREVRSKSKNSLIEKIKNLIKKSKFIYAALFRIESFIKENILGKSKRWYKFKLNEETVKKLNGFDVVYLAWPYFIEPVNFNPPVVATFHDFNYMHNFLGNFNPDMLKIVKKQTRKWLTKVQVAVTSTKFIQDELETFYPNAAKNKKVIFLAPFSVTRIGESEIEKTLKKIKVPKEYIIYSGGMSRHKNIRKLLKAISVLKKENKSIPLVITGVGTDFVGKEVEFFSKDDPVYEINKTLKEDNLKTGKDIYPLGYVSNEEVDALTKNAKLVVSPSLYEAGCGPALDAWKMGVPVAFSNIPPFLEQLEFLGTKAWVFDPNNPYDIAKKINQVLTRKEDSEKIVQESKEAIERYTWDDVAAGYYDVFREAFKGSKS